MRKIASNKNYKLSKVALTNPGSPMGPSPAEYETGPTDTPSDGRPPRGLGQAPTAAGSKKRRPTPKDRQRAKQIADIEKKIEWHKKKIQRYEAQLDKL